MYINEHVHTCNTRVHQHVYTPAHMSTHVTVGTRTSWWWLALSAALAARLPLVPAPACGLRVTGGRRGCDPGLWRPAPHVPQQPGTKTGRGVAPGKQARY